MDSNVARLHPTRRQNVLPVVPVAFLAPPTSRTAAAAATAPSSTSSSVASFQTDDEKRERSDSPDEEYRRKRNAMYVRRFYLKQNLAVDSSQEQIRVLHQQNQALQHENKRLEGLIAQARILIAKQESGEE